MEVFNANYWEDYGVYISKKKAEAKRIEKRRLTKKEKQKKLKDRNSTMKGMAKHYAKEMKKEPSVLEKRMIQFLNECGIDYEFQKPLYIKNKNNPIRKFYIADFYIPSKNLIIETDGKFHDNQIKQDENRTREIQRWYPNMKVFRWRWHDFDSCIKMKELSALLN